MRHNLKIIFKILFEKLSFIITNFSNKRSEIEIKV